MKSEVYNCDNIEYMKTIPDNYFDLAIPDPPYDSKNIQGGYTSGKGGGVAKQKEYHKALWEQSAPPKEYFDELFRISKNQIIWGANHFISLIPFNSPCWIVWDKDNGENSFADCELAWTSFDTAVRKFKFRWSGMLQENMKNKEIRIHTTQKPVELYRWILNKYAKPGQKIFDSHLGSQSSRIAAYELGYDFFGCEIDKTYFNDGCARFEAEKLKIDDVKLFGYAKSEISKSNPVLFNN